MHRQSNPIMLHETWLELFWSKFNWSVYFLRAVCRFRFNCLFKYKAIVDVLSSSIWVLYHGLIFLASTEQRNITDLFCFERDHCKAFIFFSFMAFHDVCKPCDEPKTSEDWTHKYHKTAFLFVTRFLYWIFLYLLSLIAIFFHYFFLFWHTLTVRDETCTRQHMWQGLKWLAPKWHQWCDILQGEQVELSLSRSLLPQNI